MVRMVAGIGVLAALAAFAIVLVPPYFENWKFQQYLNELSADPDTSSKPLEVVRANVVNKASTSGLPVHTDDVHVSKVGDSIKVEVLYLVHVDLALYSVDLHFRPAE